MKNKHWFFAVSDAVGLAGLIGAAISLVGVTRFPGVLPDALLFKTFFMSFGFAVGTFELAENGAVVPVKIEVDLPEVREIAILASRNPVPLLASFELGPKTRPFVATRVKLAESCDVCAVVRTANGVYIARKAVRVTVGGCGTIS